MSAPTCDAYYQFFRISLQYYVSARAAQLCGCAMIAGNLLHHAVEMLLKGELSKSVSLKDLKDNKQFGHSLPRCWDAFKKLFPAEDLTEFDPMIAELDKFEKIRYPDDVLARGAAVGVGFGKGPVFTTLTSVHRVPEYQVGIADVDAFFARAMPLCRMNPRAYFHFLTDQGRESLMKINDQAQNWLS